MWVGIETGKMLASVSTKGFQVVKFKLVIEEGEWEDLWYKDEGGRDKCMHVVVGLYDNKRSLVHNRRIPLLLTLLYDTAVDYHSKVTKQDILQVLGSPRQFIDPDNARATIRFRIEDVSKNHQGQNFRVNISADSTNIACIAPVQTRSVSIRSKRNKCQRTSKLELSISPNYASMPGASAGRLSS